MQRYNNFFEIIEFKDLTLIFFRVNSCNSWQKNFCHLLKSIILFQK